MTTANRTQRQLEYVARRSLSRYGCFGCHDIPGYETAKPIGTPLANWGRKDPSQLAFENIGDVPGDARHRRTGDASIRDATPSMRTSTVERRRSTQPATSTALDPLDDNSTPTPATSCNRSIQPPADTASCGRSCGCRGASTTKRRAPSATTSGCGCRSSRSTTNEREAVMTFVLGLTNEAAGRAVHLQARPARRRRSSQGRHVLDKYNCAGCHMLDMERWDIAFAAGSVRSAADDERLPVPRAAVDAGADQGVADARSPRPVARRRCTACRRATKRRARRSWSTRTACRSSRTTRSRRRSSSSARTSTRSWPAQLRTGRRAEPA